MQAFIKPWYLKWWGLALIVSSIIVFSLISAFGFYTLDKINQLKLSGAYSAENLIQENKLKPTSLDDVDLKSNYWIGSASPKVTIIEFGDFVCTYSQKSFIKFRELSIKYKDDLKFIYVDYPIMNDSSTALALAARCAGEQGLFWHMHDRLFISDGINEKRELFDLAERSGADIIRFKQCYESEKYVPQIRKNYLDGQALGITGTPTWFINGYRIEGDMPEEMLNSLVESLLKE